MFFEIESIEKCKQIINKINGNNGQKLMKLFNIFFKETVAAIHNSFETFYSYDE